MNNAATTSPAAITTNRPQTAAEIIGTAAAEFARDYGLDLASYNVTEGDISSVRRALANLSDSQLADLGNKITGGRR